MNKPTKNHRDLVLRFYTFLNKYLSKSKRVTKMHMTAELAYFLMGGAKAFSLNYGKDGDFKSPDARSECFDMLMAISYCDEKFELKKLGNYYFIVRKSEMRTYKKYVSLHNSRKSSDFAKAGAVYGELMGYPKTATEAWGREVINEPGKRKFLLEHHSCSLIESIFGECFFITFVYSKKYWEAEYKFQVKRHVEIYAAFPEIFKFFFLKKHADYISKIKSTLKKKQLFAALTPAQKATFLACESPLLTFKEKSLLVYGDK